MVGRPAYSRRMSMENGEDCSVLLEGQDAVAITEVTGMRIRHKTQT